MRSDKKEAIKLRKIGKSYNEIQKILGIPKSTLSLWLKKLPLSDSVKNSNIARAKTIWAQNITNYNKRKAKRIQQSALELQQSASQEIENLQYIDLKVLGIALYWCEGYKRAKWAPLFCNSDPDMIKTMMRFFREICNVPEDRFRPQVQIHPNISIEDAENYWSKVAQIDRSFFLKPLMQVSKSTKHKRPIHRLPYGTFRIGIADVKILYKIKGWMTGLAKKINQ